MKLEEAPSSLDQSKISATSRTSKKIVKKQRNAGSGRRDELQKEKGKQKL